MKYWKDGFYQEQSKNNDRIELTDEEWKGLLEQQSLGKEIYLDDNNKLNTKEKTLTDEQKRKIKINNIKKELNNIDEDILQYISGEEIVDIEERKTKFISLHNELRELLGKEKREIRKEE